MPKRTAAAEAEPETPQQSAHEQAYSRALAALREMQRQISEQETLIAGTEADLEELRHAASVQEAEARSWHKENERISAELSDAHLAQALYVGTARAASLQERIDALESRQGALAALLTSWNVEAEARQRQHSEQEHAILAQLEATRGQLADMQGQAATLQRAAQAAHAAIGQERLADVKRRIAELEHQQAQAEHAARVAEVAAYLLRKEAADQLADDYPEVAEEAQRLAPPERSRTTVLQKGGLALFAAIEEAMGMDALFGLDNSTVRALAMTPAELWEFFDAKIDRYERLRRLSLRESALREPERGWRGY